MSLRVRKCGTNESETLLKDGKKVKDYGTHLLPSKPTQPSVCSVTELLEGAGIREECPVTETRCPDADNETSVESSDLETKTGQACNKCGHKTAELKTCSRCKKTNYCSRDCQRGDWKSHRKTCKSGEGEVDNLIEQLKRSGDLQTFTLKTGSKTTLAEAKVKVEELFPGSRILDKMSMLDYRPAKGVFVGKVTVLHMNILKYGLCVTDSDGKRLSVCFKIPGNTSKPYFQTDEIGFGTFICINGARLHPQQWNLFAKEKVCVLVTDASTVRIID